MSEEKDEADVSAEQHKVEFKGISVIKLRQTKQLLRKKLLV